ncbi:type IV pilin-like G/H family protein [filamentous cyanobacterium LEGE 11480]|uniref:Type IV pilin-like G/H family protein n=1 Tax=Romeriopsis navalis LEGE 11480 TaxID=2777977 RepID=A0A928VSQ5_9CYAN|nr:type IV pilin-like G/H family protein [Romeriopsis navalis]MBE9031529.1 type IV pilin-like G/H family protein [Romeriopsis navalis LEGE 11480]
MKLIVKGLVAVVAFGTVGSAILALHAPKPACGCSSEVVAHVGTLARSQQAYFLEQGKFAATIAELGNPISGQSERNRYLMDVQLDRVIVYGQSLRPNKQGYVAGVFKIKSAELSPDGPTTTVVYCLADTKGTYKPTAPIDAQTCGGGTTKRGD